MVKVNRTPLKRFGEFNSQWQTEKLDYLVTWASGGTPSKSVDAYWNGEIPWISASSMRGLEYSDSEIKITAEGLVNGSKLARKGNLLLLVRGSMLFNKIPIGIVACDVSFNQDVKSLACKADIIPRFLLYWFYASEHKLLNMVVGTGIGAGKLDLQDLKLMDVVFPSLPEQQKIAAFLSAVDDKIRHLSKKKTLLEQYKKGLMQQLFSQNRRFKDDQGNEFPDWEEKKLGDLCKVAKSGGTPTSTKVEYYDGNIPFLSISDMTKQGKYLTYTSNHISKLGLDNSASWILPIDTIIYSMYASVGFVSINKIELATSQAVLNLILKSEVNTEFMYYSLVQFQDKTTRYITTGTQGNLNAQTVKAFKLHIPCIEEQTKIANFLSAIDNKINLVNQQLKQTRQYKKGLLQQMFV